MVNVNNKGTKTTSTSIPPKIIGKPVVSSDSVAGFEQVYVCWVVNEFEQVFAQDAQTYQIVS